MRELFELDVDECTAFGVLDTDDDDLRLMTPAYTDDDGRQAQNKSVYIIGRIALKQLRDILIESYPPDEETPEEETPEISHLELRQQWLDDMKKDPSIVWQARLREKGQLSDNGWIDSAAPLWFEELEYRRKPKTYTMYMCLVRHLHTAGLSPFSLSFRTVSELDIHCNQFGLVKVGEVVAREIGEGI
jgi:hypothetical protein